jgi:hypothetical protein
MAPPDRPRRPAGLWVLVGFGLLQGLVLLLLGIGLVLVAPEIDLVADAADPVLLASVMGGLMLTLGATQVVAALFLARGGHRARAFFGALAVLQVAVGVHAAVALRDFRATGFVQLGLSIALLWLLYGSSSVERYFAR